MRFSRRTDWNLTPNRFAQALAQARAAGREVVDLTESNPTRCGLHYDEEGIVKALITPRSFAYEPDPQGLRTAREAVARYYAERGAAAVAVDPDHIFLTTSTSEAYSYIFRLLCDPGDEVLAPAPSYPLFDYLATLQDVELRNYELVYEAAAEPLANGAWHGRWHLDSRSVELTLSPRSRAVMVVHPNNPTGSFVSDGERKGLNGIASREGLLALVADEVFLDYAHDGGERASFAGNQETLTFTLSGLSKVAALPQMKVAWLVVSGPPHLRDAALARLEVIADTFLSMNAPLQHALPTLLEQRRPLRDQLLARVRENLAELDRQLASQTLCSRLDLEGGWYATLRVPVHGDDEELAIELLERAGVLVHPGHFYDFAHEGCLAVSLITPSASFAEGTRRILQHVAGR